MDEQLLSGSGHGTLLIDVRAERIEKDGTFFLTAFPEPADAGVTGGPLARRIPVGEQQRFLRTVKKAGDDPGEVLSHGVITGEPGLLKQLCQRFYALVLDAGAYDDAAAGQQGPSAA